MTKRLFFAFLLLSLPVQAVHWSKEHFLERLDNLRQVVLLAVHPENVRYIDHASVVLERADYNDKVLCSLSEALYKLCNSLESDIDMSYKTDYEMRLEIMKLACDMRGQAKKFEQLHNFKQERAYSDYPMIFDIELDSFREHVE